MIELDIPDADLAAQGFTQNGIPSFKKTISDFAESVFSRSIKYADATKEKGMVREVSNDHIRMAVASIMGKNTDSRSSWSIAGQVAEYLMAVGTGAGLTFATSTSYLKSGLVCFFVCFLIGTLLLMIRLISNQK